MALLKSIIFATFAIALLIVNVNSNVISDYKENSVAASNTNDLIVGHREPTDALVHQENITESASIIGRIVEKKQTFNVTNGYIITQLRALDQATDGTGATGFLSAGGPGSNFATLEFESQRFHGIYFTVQIYAKKL